MKWQNQKALNSFQAGSPNTISITSKCLFIILFLSACYSTSVPVNNKDYHVHRVVNGWQAELGEAPYQVALKSLHTQQLRQNQKLYGTFCGAVLVGPNKLITAAHCVYPKWEYKFIGSSGKVRKMIIRGVYAVAGNLKNHDVFYSIDCKRHGQWRLLRSAHYPQNYIFPMHDIAVAITRRRFFFNKYVAPIPVASTNVEYSGPCLVSGFGRTSTENKSSFLMLAYLDIIPTSVCNKVHKRRMDLFVCTDRTVSDVAMGDSGGPLVCLNTGDPNEGEMGLLVGIVSGHRLEAGSFFTRVSRYNTFLRGGRSNAVHNYNIIVHLTSVTITVIYQTFFLF